MCIALLKRLVQHCAYFHLYVHDDVSKVVIQSYLVQYISGLIHVLQMPLSRSTNPCASDGAVQIVCGLRPLHIETMPKLILIKTHMPGAYLLTYCHTVRVR